jgi:hypothetical protein
VSSVKTPGLLSDYGYVGDLNATVGADWSTNVLNKPTTLAALDATAASDLDGKTVTYYQDEPPAGTVNDLWFDTNDGNKLYRHNGSTWVVVQDAGIAAAASAASSAQSTANSKVTTFYNTSAPTALATGDLWYNTDDKKLKRWTGSEWLEVATVGATVGSNLVASDGVTVLGEASVLNSSVTLSESNGVISLNGGGGGEVIGTWVGTAMASTNYSYFDSGWKLDRESGFEFNGPNTTTVLDAGNVITYVRVGGAAYPYQSLTHVEFGECANNTEVTIPGYFISQPKVIVSPRNLAIYHKDYSAQTQALDCSPGPVVETSSGSKQWKFTPVATLALASATSNVVINTNNSDSDSNNLWASEERTSPANTTSISVSASALSVRGTGTSGYYYRRTVRARIAYKLSGGAYSYTSWVTQNIGDTISVASAFSLSVSGLSVNTYLFKVEYEAYDTDGTSFSTGGTSYTYSDTTVTGPTTTVTAQAYSAGGYIQDTDTYTIGSATGSGEIYKLEYSVDCEANSVNASASAVVSGKTVVQSISSLASRAVRSVTSTGSNMSFDSTIALTATATNGGSAYVSVHQASCKIYRRTAVANSTTPTNTGSFVSYTVTLSSAQVLATGTLNWMAVGT